MMETCEIEETLSSTRLRAPETIFVLSTPIVFPQKKALVYGLNPRFERTTIVLGSNATRETVVHETLHQWFGEIVTYPLAKIITRVRTLLPVTRRKQVRYEEKIVSSEELKKYGLTSYEHVNGFVPTNLKIKRLTLAE